MASMPTINIFLGGKGSQVVTPTKKVSKANKVKEEKEKKKPVRTSSDNLLSKALRSQNSALGKVTKAISSLERTVRKNPTSKTINKMSVGNGLVNELRKTREEIRNLPHTSHTGGGI